MTAETLIRGRAVLTGRLDLPEITGGAVAVAGPRIAEVGPYAELRTRFPAAQVIGGEDCVVLPGLVSAHQHGGGAGSVQLGCPDQPFERWLIEMLRIPSLDIENDTVYHAIRLLENGITTTVHSHYVRDSSQYREEVRSILAGYATVGTRVAFTPHYIDQNFLTYGDDDGFIASLPLELRETAVALSKPAIAADEYLALVDELAIAADPARERILYGPVAPQWCTDRMLSAIGEAIQRTKRGAHLHLLETAAQREYFDRRGGSVVEHLADLGLIGPRVSFAHGIWVRPAEINLLAEHQSTVVLNPGCNLRLGTGQAPISALMAAGVPVAVGTDDMTLNDDDDLLAEMRLVAGIARTMGRWIGPPELLHAATQAGAQAALMGDEVGSLEVGKRADVVVLDAGRFFEPWTTQEMPVLDVTVARARGADVRTVMIDGRVVLRDGVVVGLDRSEIASRIRQAAVAQTSSNAYRKRAAVISAIASKRLPPFAGSGPMGSER